MMTAMSRRWIHKDIPNLDDSSLLLTSTKDTEVGYQKIYGPAEIETYYHTKLQQEVKDANLQELNTDALALKDILPTISINDASAHINSTDCRRCRAASIIQLRNITSDAHEQHTTTDDGLEIHLNPTIKENVSAILCNEGAVSPLIVFQK